MVESLRQPPLVRQKCTLTDSLRRYPFRARSGKVESSQYLNVWSMLIVCIGINAMGTNLRVEVVDSILGKTPLGKKIVVIIRDVFIILFYVMVTYGGYQLCTRAKQAVSTMPQFTMGQVYTIFPIAGVLCILSAVLNLIVELTAKPEGGKSK